MRWILVKSVTSVEGIGKGWEIIGSNWTIGDEEQVRVDKAYVKGLEWGDKDLWMKLGETKKQGKGERVLIVSTKLEDKGKKENKWLMLWKERL